jgi:acetoin utilization deacetylase AcuC-like enzyme
LNVPLRAGTPALQQKRMFDAALDDISGAFKPDLIMISAGFDSHNGDPLGQLLLEDEDFVSLTRTVKGWAKEACHGRIVSCLEGGYNLQTLGETVRAHVIELQNEPS